MRRAMIGLGVALLLPARAALAQYTTQCTGFGNSVTCNSGPSMDAQMNATGQQLGQAIGSLAAGIHQRREKARAHKRFAEDSARLSQRAVFIPLYTDSTVTVSIDTATTLHEGSLHQFRVAYVYRAPRKSPAGSIFNGALGWALLDCAGTRARILQGGMYLMSNDSTPPKLVDLMQPTPPEQWIPLAGPTDAAAVQHFCY
jgi:hypothetical protein